MCTENRKTTNLCVFPDPQKIGNHELKNFHSMKGARVLVHFDALLVVLTGTCVLFRTLWLNLAMYMYLFLTVHCKASNLLLRVKWKS